MAIATPRTLARTTDGLFLNREFRFPAVVEVAERDCDTNFHILASSFAAAVPEVAAAAEETGEEVEGVVVLLLAASALLVLLNAFVTVLVVDSSRFFGYQDVVGFGDCDEFIVGCVVTSRVLLDYAESIYRLHLCDEDELVGRRTGSCRGGISWRVSGRRI